MLLHLVFILTIISMPVLILFLFFIATFVAYNFILSFRWLSIVSNKTLGGSKIFMILLLLFRAR